MKRFIPDIYAACIFRNVVVVALHYIILVVEHNIEMFHRSDLFSVNIVCI